MAGRGADRLRALYEQMRKIKQVDLAMADGEKDPVRRARARELALKAIAAVEVRIEEEMNNGRVSGSHEAGEEDVRGKRRHLLEMSDRRWRHMCVYKRPVEINEGRDSRNRAYRHGLGGEEPGADVSELERGVEAVVPDNSGEECAVREIFHG